MKSDNIYTQQVISISHQRFPLSCFFARTETQTHTDTTQLLGAVLITPHACQILPCINDETGLTQPMCDRLTIHDTLDPTDVPTWYIARKLK